MLGAEDRLQDRPAVGSRMSRQCTESLNMDKKREGRVLTSSSDSPRGASGLALLMLLAMAGCAQPVDAPDALPENEAASVADLQATAERIAAELPGRTEGLAYPAPPLPSDVPALQQISQAEWRRLEEAARAEIPAMITQVEKLAPRR